MSSYFNYKNQQYHCDNCGWCGLGCQTDENDDIKIFIALCCPECYKNLDCISFPTLEETLEHGTEEDKAYVLKRQDFLTRVQALRANIFEKLPDIEADEVIIALREEAENGDIVLFWQNREVWREPMAYEYYGRYLEIGRLLKNKYGDRLVDFETEYTTYLGGDCLSAFDEVRKFRKSLKGSGGSRK